MVKPSSTANYMQRARAHETVHFPHELMKFDYPFPTIWVKEGLDTDDQRWMALGYPSKVVYSPLGVDNRVDVLLIKIHRISLKYGSSISKGASCKQRPSTLTSDRLYTNTGNI